MLVVVIAKVARKISEYLLKEIVLLQRMQEKYLSIYSTKSLLLSGCLCLTCITSGAIQNGVPITVFLLAIVS